MRDQWTGRGFAETSGKDSALSSSARANSRSRTPRAVRHPMTTIAAAAAKNDSTTTQNRDLHGSTSI